MAAALKYHTADSHSASALLGVERSARGYRWIERLEPARAHLASCDRPSPRASRAARARACGAWRRDRHRVRAISIHRSARCCRTRRDFRTWSGLRRASPRQSRQGRRLPLFGDYDVDGAASVALIERYLRAHGQSALTYHPRPADRGLWPDARRRCASLVARWRAPDPHRRLWHDGFRRRSMQPTRQGAEMIVIDHHQADEALPRAYAVAEPEPSGRSVRAGASGGRRGRFPVPGGDHAGSAPRGLFSRSRRA